MPETKSTATGARDNLISQKVATLPPSGIRKFFDLLSSMEDVISPGILERRAYILWKKAIPCILPIPACRNYARNWPATWRLIMR
jgi:hypothetical protein